jgi:hypothetical protein
MSEHVFFMVMGGFLGLIFGSQLWIAGKLSIIRADQLVILHWIGHEISERRARNLRDGELKIVSPDEYIKIKTEKPDA